VPDVIGKGNSNVLAWGLMIQVLTVGLGFGDSDVGGGGRRGEEIDD